MRTLALLPFFLLSPAVSGTGCHPFEKDWANAGADATRFPADGLSGRWEGEWRSYAVDHSGPLRCIVTPAGGEGRFTADYHAYYAGLLQFGMKIEMTARKDGPAWTFEGSHDLGIFGVFDYTGRAQSGVFTATYRSLFDHGVFSMCRVGPPTPAEPPKPAEAPKPTAGPPPPPSPETKPAEGKPEPTPTKGELGKPAADFTLTDVATGKPVKLSGFKGKPLVICFQGANCGMVDRHQERIAKLAADYAGKGVALVAVNSNADETVEEIRAYAERKKLPFPTLRDADHAAADYFGAKHTPCFAVLDPAGAWRYVGSLDDNPFPDKVTKSYVREALDALLAGKEPPTARTKDYGCKINRGK
jgi:peroxiredoxin